MRGLRKVASKKKPGRRFSDREDSAHLERVRALPCLLRGKRCTLTRWKGVYPDVEEVTEEYAHVCGGTVEAHHVVLKAQGGHDYETVPLCTTAHNTLHALGQPAFELRWSVDLVAEALRLAPKKEVRE